MILNSINWRLASTPTIPASRTNTDIIATLKAQIQSCQYWQLVESPNTGSTSLLIKPVATYSSCSNMNVVIASAITGSTAYRPVDVTTGNSTKLQIGLTPDVTGLTGSFGSGSFRGPNADRPFQTVSADPLWTKYTHFADCTLVSASYIIESQESIFIGFKETASSGTMGVLAGSIIESQDALSGMYDRRIFGIITNNSSIWSTTFWSNTTTFFSTPAGTTTPRVIILITSGGIPNPDSIWNANKVTIYRTPAPELGSLDVISGSAKIPASILLPIPFHGVSTQALGTYPMYLGLSRGFYMGPKSIGLTRHQVSGIDKYYSVSSTYLNSTGYSDSLYFYPASGSI